MRHARGGLCEAHPSLISGLKNRRLNMSNESYKTKLEYGVASVVALIGVFFVYQALTIRVSTEAVGPRTMPMTLAIALILGAFWLAVRAFRGKVGEVKAEYGFLDSDIKRICLVIGCGMLFVITFWGFGYFTAIVVGYISTLLAFGVREKTKVISSAIIMAVVFQWLFMGVMRLNDTRGYLIDLRPYTNLISGD
jgi:hypothetical protein